MTLVRDNSVVSGWLLANQATPYCNAIARRLLDDRAVADNHDVNPKRRT